VSIEEYREFHRRSLENPEDFWAEQAQAIDWHKPFDKVLDYENPPFSKWFVGGETNICHNAVDRHLEERGDQKALVYVSTETDEQRTYTYRELYAEVNAFAGIIQELGVSRGDRVVIYMPMMPEAIFAMLASVSVRSTPSSSAGSRPRTSQHVSTTRNRRSW
jgi:propionyl-CoA synthetase